MSPGLELAELCIINLCKKENFIIFTAIFEMLGPGGMTEADETPQSRVDKIFSLMDKVSENLSLL